MTTTKAALAPADLVRAWAAEQPSPNWKTFRVSTPLALESRARESARQMFAQRFGLDLSRETILVQPTGDGNDQRWQVGFRLRDFPHISIWLANPAEWKFGHPVFYPGWRTQPREAGYTAEVAWVVRHGTRQTLVEAHVAAAIVVAQNMARSYEVAE